MQSVLRKAVAASSGSIGEVARLIGRPVGDVRKLMNGECDFFASEIVVIARAAGVDWRPLLLCAFDRARHQGNDRLVEDRA